MRIVSGKYRGKRLVAPDGDGTRPTTDRVRESLFNILNHGDFEIDHARVLDIFAGTGALGLEALSRGAAYALFVENDAAARGTIRQNVENLGAQGITQLLRRDATKLGPRISAQGSAFNLVFLDPPYGKGLGKQALASALEGGWIADDATLVFECGQDENPMPDGFKLIDERTYGGIKICFFKKVALQET